MVRAATTLAAPVAVSRLPTLLRAAAYAGAAAVVGGGVVLATECADGSSTQLFRAHASAANAEGERCMTQADLVWSWLAPLNGVDSSRPLPRHDDLKALTVCGTDGKITLPHFLLLHSLIGGGFHCGVDVDVGNAGRRYFPSFRDCAVIVPKLLLLLRVGGSSRDAVYVVGT